MDGIEIAPDPPTPAYLTIPFDDKSFLPRKCLSVAKLLQYEFPNPFWTPHNGASIQIWSDSPPHDIQAALLLSCTVPQWETVRRLLLEVQQLTSTPQSFNRTAVSSCEVLPNYLPIWVLSFWDCLSEAYNTCQSWRRSLDWVNALCVQCPASQSLALELDSLFQRVCWYGYLNGKRRDRHVNDIFDLLSNNELDSGQIGDLLELIERKLADASDDRYLIAPTDLATLILYSHQDHKKCTYRKQPSQQLVEEELVQRHRSAVASIAWISVSNRGHWISYIVDPINSTIFHGDSLGLQIPPDLCNALRWWLSGLRERMGEPPNLPHLKPISVACQGDGFSCGILSTNSLLHHLLPYKFPLVSKDANSITTYRIEHTIEILKLSVEPVRVLPQLLCISHLGEDSGRRSK